MSSQVTSSWHTPPIQSQARRAAEDDIHEEQFHGANPCCKREEQAVGQQIRVPTVLRPARIGRQQQGSAHTGKCSDSADEVQHELLPPLQESTNFRFPMRMPITRLRNYTPRLRCGVRSASDLIHRLIRDGQLPYVVHHWCTQSRWAAPASALEPFRSSSRREASRRPPADSGHTSSASLSNGAY